MCVYVCKCVHTSVDLYIRMCGLCACMVCNNMYVMLLALMYWWPSNTATCFLWVVAVVAITRFPDESEITVTLYHYTCNNCISICLTI